MSRAPLAALVVFVVGLLANPSAAMAQAKKGDKEVQVAGNIFQTLGGDFGVSQGTGLFGIGFFVSDRMQISVVPQVTVSTFSTPVFNNRGIQTGTDREIDMNLGVSSKLVRFMGAADAKLKPYWGANFIINDLSSAGDSAFGAATFGFKNYLSEKAALDLNGSYGLALKHPGDSQILQVTVGITYIF